MSERYASWLRRCIQPSPVDVAMRSSLYPQERRLISRGHMTLQNTQECSASTNGQIPNRSCGWRSRLEVKGGTPVIHDEVTASGVFRA